MGTDETQIQNDRKPRKGNLLACFTKFSGGKNLCSICVNLWPRNFSQLSTINQNKL